MDWTTIIVSIITLIGGGTVGSIVGAKSAQKKARIEADAAATEKALSDHSGLIKMHEQDQKIIADNAVEIKALRDKVASLETQVHDLTKALNEFKSSVTRAIGPQRIVNDVEK